MRIVLDTNVLVSGIFFGGVPGRILTAWAEGKVALVLSPDILDEYRRVGVTLGSRHPDLAAALAPVLALLATNASIVNARSLAEPVSEDPADDMFLRRERDSSSPATSICSASRAGAGSLCSPRGSSWTSIVEVADS